MPARTTSGNSGIRLSIMFATLICAIACMAQTAAPTHHCDFRKWFRTLAQNRTLYNSYNDSIFQIHDHDHWIRFFQMRAKVNHEINRTNKLVIDSINYAVTLEDVLCDRRQYHDNTQSPYRTLTDILTLSDCLQAATERIGRNYKNQKKFDTVIDEFRQDAGTRYNPEVVEFIDRHPELANRLRWLLTDGWLDIYYMIYKKYFANTDKQ